MPRPRRVLGYARVSSAEQALGTSLGDQQEAIRAYAQTRGLTVTKFYVEAESAIHEKIERREQMRALLREARKGDLVICDKLDRWSRDPAFSHTSIRDLLQAGVSFYAVSDRCDPSTSEGDTMLGFRVLFAREEHKRIRQRMVGTRDLLRDRGYYAAGIPPMGYRRSSPRGTKGIEKNILVIVPEEAETVRTIFRLYVSGYSMTKLAKQLDLKLDRVKDALHNRTYLGEQRNSRGEWIKGRHEPLIQPDVFARVQETIAARRLGGPRPRDAESETSTWILRDVARCLRCGAKMSAAYAGPKGPSRRYYYRCSKRCQSKGSRATNGGFVPVPEAEAMVDGLVLERLEELRDDIARGAEPAPSSPAADIASKRAKLEQRRARYVEMYADDHIDRDGFRKRIATLDAETLKLDAEESKLLRPSALNEPHIRRALLKEVGTIRKVWRHATPQERRQFVNLLLLSVSIAKGEAPQPVWRSAEDLAADLRA